MLFRTLSGRFLILTIVFVMLAEVLIFVPSIARFRVDYLLSRLERGQIAALAQIAADNMISAELEQELLINVEVFNIVLLRKEMRQLILSSPVPAPIEATYDLRSPSSWALIRDAMFQLIDKNPHIIRVIGEPVHSMDLLIEVTMETSALRAAMIDYGFRIFVLSAIISIMTSALLFFAVRKLMVVPIARVVGQVRKYAQDPQDGRRIIVPSASVKELREAENAVETMQIQLTGALKQHERLAQQGQAVAKISHDLRNILTTAQLFTDRMEVSKDPIVKRAVPKLVNSISRAVNLCEATLTFGKAEEPPPALNRIHLAKVVEDVLENERMAVGNSDIVLTDKVPDGMMIRADGEQLYRVLANLVRNARQAIAASSAPGEIIIEADESDEGWSVTVSDSGPGLPPKAQEHLFKPFTGGTRKEGSGLGLAIAAELVRGHGGRLDLLSTSNDGTVFSAWLPKTVST